MPEDSPPVDELSGSTHTRWVVAGVWVAIAVGYVVYYRSQNQGPLEVTDSLRRVLADNWWGPLLFVVAYVLRPLVFFPATVLTILGGLAFGPVWGTVWTLAAANLSMAASFFVGRFFGTERLTQPLRKAAGGLMSRARRHPFEVTLVMRLIYLPFDLVGYVAGFLRLRYSSYASASFLGTLPGTVAFVGFGASVDRIDGGRPTFDIRILLLSVVLAAAGVLVSRVLRRHQEPVDLTPSETQ